MNPENIWETVKEEISKRISKPSFDTWFARLPGRVEGDQHLIVQASNVFQRDWVINRYQQLIQAVLKEVTQQEFTLEIICEDEEDTFLLSRNTTISENEETESFYIAKDPENVWETVKEEISRRISKPSFDTWFARLPGRVEGDQHLIVHAPNIFARDWVTDRYQQLIQEVLKELTKQEFTLEITCEDEEDTFLESKVEKINQEAALGYMLLACKEVQLTAEQVAQLHSTMKKSFDSHTIKEAEREHMDFKTGVNLMENLRSF